MTTPDQAAPPDSHEAIAWRAADYCQRRRFGGWSAADQAELDAWLEEAAAHRVAWLRVEWSVGRTEQLAALRHPHPGREAPHNMRPVVRRRFMLPLLAAASVVLVAALGVSLAFYLVQTPDRVFGTNVGGRALLKFQDGTEVELNTDTALRFRMTSQERTIWLDRGEAYFRVTHNAALPFAVVAGGHRVTDLGTEFLVRDDATGLDVALVKGRAQLASDNPVTPVAMLVPGDEALATHASTIITRKTPRELADEMAWRRGVLVFRNTTLADAVREFNRYNEIKLVIADPSIADVKFSAEVKTDGFEDFLAFAQAMLKLRVNRQGNDILISRDARVETKSTVRSRHGA